MKVMLIYTYIILAYQPQMLFHFYIYSSSQFIIKIDIPKIKWSSTFKELYYNY